MSIEASEMEELNTFFSQADLAEVKEAAPEMEKPKSVKELAKLYEVSKHDAKLIASKPLKAKSSKTKKKSAWCKKMQACFTKRLSSVMKKREKCANTTPARHSACALQPPHHRQSQPPQQRSSGAPRATR